MPPAEKKAPAAKKVRSRAGCTRCRRQRKRCDEQKPACARCQEVGQPCSYELNIKWGGRAFPKMLGTYAGRVQRLNNADEGGGFVYVAQSQQGPSVPRHTPGTAAAAAVALPPTHLSLSHPLPASIPAAEYAGQSGYRQIPNGDDEATDIADPVPSPDAASMALVRQGWPWEIDTDLLSRADFNRPVRSLEFAPDLSRIHRFLLNHYVHDTIRLTAPSDYARTEICRSVVPMAYDQPCLLFAMMAFAARHLYALGALPVGDSDLPGNDAEEVIAELEDRSMSSLRQHLTEPNFNQHAVALATTRTLCQSQILAAGDSWRTHLEGARAILQAASSQAQFKSKFTTGGESGLQKSRERDGLDAGEPSIHDFLASWYNNVEALAALTPLGLRRGQLEMANVPGRRNVYFDVFGGLVSDVPDLFREVGALVIERRRRMKRAQKDCSSNSNNEDDDNNDDNDDNYDNDDNDAEDIDRGDSILSDDDIALEAESLVENIHARLEQDTVGNLRMDNNLLVSLSPDNMHDYAMSNASFLHTALLYLHCAVQGLPLSAPAVRHSVEQIVWCYGNMKSASALSPRVLMGTPLFTAGLWAMPDVQGAIRGYFATMGTWMRTPHNVRSSAVLEFVWSKTSSPHHHHDVLTYLEESPDFLPY